MSLLEVYRSLLAKAQQLSLFEFRPNPQPKPVAARGKAPRQRAAQPSLFDTPAPSRAKTKTEIQQGLFGPHNPALLPVEKVVHEKGGGTHVQTYHVLPEEYRGINAKQPGPAAEGGHGPGYAPSQVKPEQASNPKEIAAPSSQPGESERNAATLLDRLGLRSKILEGEDFHLTLPNEPYPLTIERHNEPGGPRVYLTHYARHEDGTAMDSELVFRVGPDGVLQLEETAAQNPLGGELRRGGTYGGTPDRGFAQVFSANLLRQRHRGETKTEDGRTYQLNENSRWERVDPDALAVQLQDAFDLYRTDQGAGKEAIQRVRQQVTETAQREGYEAAAALADRAAMALHDKQPLSNPLTIKQGLLRDVPQPEAAESPLEQRPNPEGADNEAATPEAPAPMPRGGVNYAGRLSEILTRLPRWGFGLLPKVTAGARRAANDRAVALSEQIEQAGRPPTPEERQILAQYTGEGGLSGDLNAHYTPTPLAAAMWKLLLRVGGEIKTALEPSMGNGVFFHTAPEGVRLTGVELSPTSGRIARQLHEPNGHIVHAGMAFEDYNNSQGQSEHFDAVIANPPYGLRGSWVAKGKPQFGKAEEYFIDATLDRLKDGGAAIHLINGGPVENLTRRDFRARLLARAEILGVYQLPQSTFKESNSGVPPVVLLLRKRPDAEAMTLYRLYQRFGEEALAKAGVLDQDFLDGKLTEMPENIFGEWDGKTTTFKGYKDIKGELTPELLERLAGAPLRPARPIDSEALQQAYGDDYASAREWATTSASDYERGRVSEGAYSEDGKLVFRGGRWVTLTDDNPLLGRAVEVSHLLAEYAHVLNNGRRADAEALRQTAQQAVQDFLEEYGNPHLSLAKEAAHQHRLAHLLVAVNKDGTLAAHLSQPVADEDGAELLDRSDPHAVARYLAAKHQLSPGLFAKFYAGTPDEAGGYPPPMAPHQALDWLHTNGYAMDETGRWMPDEEFYQGNIYERAAALEQAAQGVGLTGKEQQILLEQARRFRERLPRKRLEEVTITARDAFVNPKAVAAFIGEVLDPGHRYRVTRSAAGRYQVEGLDGHRPEVVEQFEDYLNFETKAESLTARDKHMTEQERQAARAEFREQARRQENEFAEQFKAWAAGSDFRDELEEAYNQTFNAYIPLRLSTAPLDLPRWRSVSLHPYQNECIRHALHTGSSVIALDVGLGKTSTGMALAEQLLQQGRAKRVCHVMPKSLLGNWRNSYAEMTTGRWYPTEQPFRLDQNRLGAETVADAQRVHALISEHPLSTWGDLEAKSGLSPERYQAAVRALASNDLVRGVPGDHVMVIGESFDPKRRRWTPDDDREVAQKLAQLATGNHTHVLITREKFAMIPVRDETVERMVHEDAVRARMFEDREESGRKSKSARDWVEELTEAQQKARQKMFGNLVRVLNFEDLGIDALISDEHHAFKNLHQAPRIIGESPKFLGASAESKRAQDMLIKARLVRERAGGGNVFPMTATPTKNSPLEVYNMLRYVTDAIDKIAPTPKAFIDRYCDVGAALVAVPGGVAFRSAVLGFKNLKELRGVMGRFLFRRTAQDVGLKIPEREDHTHIFEMSPEQRAEYQHLAQAAEAATKEREAQGSDHFFSFLARMRTLTLDPGVYDPQSFTGNNPRFEKAAEISRRALDEGGKVVMFMDLGQPQQAEEGGGAADAMDDEELRVYAEQNGLKHQGIPTAKLRSMVADHLERTQANAYERLRQHLVEQGIPADQIAIVTAKTAKSSEERANVEAAYKAGRIKVVIGSTGVIGEGFNLQTGTTDMVHLDIPWEPGTYWQRLGRAVRQGNTQPKVRNHVLLAKGSIDSLTYGTMLGKKGWTDVLWNSEDDYARNADALDANNNPYNRMLIETADDPEAVQRLLEEKAQEARVQQAQIAQQAAVKRLKELATQHSAVLKFRRLAQEGEQMLAQARKSRDPELPSLERKVAERRAKAAALEADYQAQLRRAYSDPHLPEEYRRVLESGQPFLIDDAGRYYVEGGVVTTAEGARRRVWKVDPIGQKVYFSELAPSSRHSWRKMGRSSRVMYDAQPVAIRLKDIGKRVQDSQHAPSAAEMEAAIAQRVKKEGPQALRFIHPERAALHTEAIQQALKEHRPYAAWVVDREGRPVHRSNYQRNLIGEGERYLLPTPADRELFQAHYPDLSTRTTGLQDLPWPVMYNPNKQAFDWLESPTPELAVAKGESLVDVYNRLKGGRR